MDLKTEFKGDENWELIEDFDKKSFFYGWFNKKSGKLLEGGCGVGNYVVILSKLGFNVTGIEIDKERVEISLKNIKKYKVNAKIVEGDIRKLPFKDNEFDYIFSHGVVEHFKDTEIALKEFYRVLKKDGNAMISVPARFSSFLIFKYLQIFLDKLLGTNLWNCGYEKSFSIWKFKRMLKNIGFVIIDQRINEAEPGKRFPIVGKIERILDKPLYLLGIGGRFMNFYCKK
jgi:ubiquinone/menaquinone biosynthesis C-methylase UbiE